MPQLSILVVPVLCVLAGQMDAAPSRSPARRVRPLQSEIEQSLRRSYSLSPTFRAVVDALERSDVIAHIIYKLADERIAGSMQFVTQGGDVRYVRIAISPRLSGSRLAEILAHELQHALEVARAPWVRDAASFAQLYRRIGHACHGSGTKYDTEAARNVGTRVLEEVSRK